MYGRPLTILPYDQTAGIIDDPNYEPTPTRLIQYSIRQSETIYSFRRIFRRDYLTSLREFHKATKSRYVQIIKVGEVLLVDDDGPRPGWPMAVVEKLIVSRDAADIRTANGKTNRPIAKLVPLEVTEPSSISRLLVFRN